MTKRLILIRHTTTSWNREKRLQGQTDIELDDGGREEARVLAEEFQNLGIERIVSSDLKRARETAEIINEVLQVPLQTEDRLRETRFGSLEGTIKEEAIARYGDSLATYFKDDATAYDFGEYGGESRDQVKDRHLQVIGELRTMPEEVILIVGHGSGLNTLLGSLGEEANLRRNEWRVVEFH